MRKRRKKRSGYRFGQRLGAVMLASVMTITNVGADLDVSFAASGEDVTFVVRGAELVRSVREAVYEDRAMTPEDLEFTNGKTEKFEKLFFEDGTVYEAFPEFDTDGGMDAEVRVFVKLPEPLEGEEKSRFLTGEEELIFLYINNGESSISCNTEVVSSFDEDEVLKRTKKIKVKSFEEAFGDEEVEIITNPATSSNAETVPEETTAAATEPAGETVTETGAPETETAESGEAQTTGAETTASEEPAGTTAGAESQEAKDQELLSQEPENQKEEPADSEKEPEKEENAAENEPEKSEPEHAEDEAAGESGELQAAISRYAAPKVATSDQSEGEPKPEAEPAAEQEPEEIKTEEPAEPDSESAESRENKQSDENPDQAITESSAAESSDGGNGESQAGPDAEQAESSAANPSESGGNEPGETEANGTESSAADPNQAESVPSGEAVIATGSEAEPSTATGSEAETEAPKQENQTQAADSGDLAGINWCSTGKVYFTTLNKLDAFEDVAGFLIDYMTEPDDDLAKIDGPVMLEAEEELYFTVEPEDGYRILSVTANGIELEPVEVQETLKKGPSEPKDAVRAAEPEEDVNGGPGVADVPEETPAEVLPEEEEAEEASEIRAYRVEQVEENMEISVLVEEIPTWIPAAVYQAGTDEVLVSVTAPDGAFEEKVELKVTKIVEEAQLTALEENVKNTISQNETIEEIAAYDVTFLSAETGEEREPLLPVEVAMEFRQPLIPQNREAASEAAEDFSLIHISDQNGAEKVAEASGTEAKSFEFQLDSFSPIVLARIASTTKAKIGETEYSTVQAAIDAAKDGDVIVLQKDCSSYKKKVTAETDLGENLKITGKTLTIDLNGYTLAGKKQKPDSTNELMKGVASVITLDQANVTLVGSGESQILGYHSYRIITATNGSNLTIGRENGDGPALLGTSTVCSRSYTIKETVGKNQGGIIYAENSNVVISGGTISGGYVSANSKSEKGYGGGIAVVNGSLTVSGGTIKKNQVILKDYEGSSIQSSGTGGGGGIYIQNGRLEVTGGTITGNNVANSGRNTKSYRGDGGGIYAEKSDVRLTGGVISGNYARGCGGGIYIYNSPANAEIEIGAVEISNNIARIALSGGYGGGGIACLIPQGKGSVLKIHEGSRISGNEVGSLDLIKQLDAKKGVGGGIAAEIPVIVYGGEITDNRADYQGGGIYAPELTIVGGTISGNTVKNAPLTDRESGGGGIYCEDTLDIRGGTIQNNTSSSFGGGAACVVTTYSEGKILLGESADHTTTICDNTAKRGGGIYVYSKKALSIGIGHADGIRMYRNTAKEEQPAGGAYASDEILILKENKSYRITPTGLLVPVGAEQTQTSYQLQQDGADYILHQYVEDGWMGYYHAKDLNPEYAAAKGTLFLDPLGECKKNMSHYYYEEDAENPFIPIQTPETGLYTTLEEAVDAAIANGQKQIVVCSEVELSAKDNAVIQKGKENQIEFARCQYNTKYDLFKITGTEQVVLDGISIDGKQVVAERSMIYMPQGSSLKITGDTVLKNHYSTCGGAAVRIYKGELLVEGGTFLENHSSKSGGAIYAEAASIVLDGGVFEGNSADGSGGAIDIEPQTIFENGTTLKVEGNRTIFKNNQCGNQGGAIKIGIACEAEIYQADFIGNKSTLPSGNYAAGGAIYIHGSQGCYGSLHMKNLYIAENKYITTSQEAYGTLYSCPTGKLSILQVDGALICNNGTAPDIYSASHYDDSTMAFVSELALGGGYANWYGDVLRKNPVPKEYYQFTNKGMKLYSDPGTDTITVAETIAKETGVYMTGNGSNAAGSVIANNGRLVIGTEQESLKVVKEWKNENGEPLTEHPDQIFVYLTRTIDGVTEKVQGFRPDEEYVILNEANGWSYTWENLGAAKDSDGDKIVTWGVAEVGVSGYESRIEREQITDLEDTGIDQAYRIVLTNQKSENAKFHNLEISKEVRPVNLEEAFEFTVNFPELNDETALAWYLTGADGTRGEMTPVYDNGEIKFSLKHGEAVSIQGIPDGTEYKIKETADAKYNVYVNGQLAAGGETAGTVKAEDQKAAYLNEVKPDTPPPPPDRPSGGGGGGGGGDDGGGGRYTPSSGGPGVTIVDEGVPLANLPGDPVIIDPEEIPLAPLPKTGESSRMLLVMAFSGIALAISALMNRKHREER